MTTRYDNIVTANHYSDRSVVRRHEMMQKHLEKCEEIMSAKSDAKDALAKEVNNVNTDILFDDDVLMTL